MKVSDIKKNPGNPRQIKGEKLELLKASVGGFQKMMPLRPIVIDENNAVLGGNMRLAAIKALGLKDIPDEWVKKVTDLTEDEKKEFIIKDNAGFGEWDWDVIANEWSDLPLADWGLDVPGFESIGIEYGDKNKELDMESFEDKQVITLEYTSDEASRVRSALYKVAPTLEQAVFQLLDLDES